MKAVDLYVAGMLANLKIRSLELTPLMLAEWAQEQAEAVCRVSGHDTPGPSTPCLRCEAGT